MSQILNVTREEFRDIQQIAMECVDLTGQLNEAELQRRLWIRLGVWLDGPHEVKVRDDVPSIPWLTKGVRRIGPDERGWGT